MIVGNYETFRWMFAVKASANSALTFADANPDRVNRAAGSFVADGFAATMRVLPAGTVSNDKYYTIASLTATDLTLSAADAVTNEGPVVADITGWYVDPDGRPQWPTSKLDVAGFTDTITGIPQPYLGVSFTATCNAGAADAAFSVDEYNWYLSQRGGSYISLAQKAASATQTFSGSVDIVHTATAESEFNFTPTTADEDAIRNVFNRCDLYVQRISDGAIQHVQLYTRMMTTW